MGKIVTMPRSEGDVLVRMKGEYEEINNIGSSFKAVRFLNDNEAYLLKRKGRPYSVADEYEVEDVVKAFLAGLIGGGRIPSGSYLPDEAVVNQTGSTLTQKSDSEYTITHYGLEKYVLNYEDYAAEGEQFWVAIGISTGEASVVGLKVNGKELTDTDVNEAKLLGMSEGGFIYWIPIVEGVSNHLVLENNGKTAVITFSNMVEGD